MTEPPDPRPAGAFADEFYVGYLPAPPGHARFIRRFIVAAVLSAAALATLVVVSFRPPGDAIWLTSNVEVWEGTLVEHPYPMLHTTSGAHLESLLLVDTGKRGAQLRVRGMDGARVRIEGWRLERDGRRIIELAPERSAVTPLDAPTPRRPVFESVGEITLRGEIIDSKCFLGAMKPGDGKGHKACAILCITGGVPPMLVTRSASDVPDFYLLTSPDGGPLTDPAIIELAGEPVVLTGALSKRAGLLYLAVEACSVRRAGPGA